MKPKVYVETSVISYLAARTSRDVIIAGRQAATHDWWENHRQRFEVFVSALVEQEIGRGNPEQSRARLEVVATIESIAVSSAAVAISEALLSSAAIPGHCEDDALHIGIATVQGVDFLLTWNFKHINNARKTKDIVRIIEALGYSAPKICTPDELGGDKDD